MKSGEDTFIQDRSFKLLTSLQAVPTQPRAILRLLLMMNQMLVIFAALGHPHYERLLHSSSDVFLCLVSTLDLMHKFICVIMFVFCFLCVCVCVCGCTSACGTEAADKLIEDLGIKNRPCEVLSHLNFDPFTLNTRIRTHTRS